MGLRLDFLLSQKARSGKEQIAANDDERANRAHKNSRPSRRKPGRNTAIGWRSDLPRGRQSGNSRQGRSPGSGIILRAAPSRQHQWHVRRSSPLTVAGQRGICTPFPLRPLTRDPTRVMDGLNTRTTGLSSREHARQTTDKGGQKTERGKKAYAALVSQSSFSCAGVALLFCGAEASGGG